MEGDVHNAEVLSNRNSLAEFILGDGSGTVTIGSAQSGVAGEGLSLMPENAMLLPGRNLAQAYRDMGIVEGVINYFEPDNTSGALGELAELAVTAMRAPSEEEIKYCNLWATQLVRPMVVMLAMSCSDNSPWFHFSGRNA